MRKLLLISAIMLCSNVWASEDKCFVGTEGYIGSTALMSIIESNCEGGNILELHTGGSMGAFRRSGVIAKYCDFDSQIVLSDEIDYEDMIDRYPVKDDNDYYLLCKLIDEPRIDFRD